MAFDDWRGMFAVTGITGKSHPHLPICLAVR
jgi:hypothetical protein